MSDISILSISLTIGVICAVVYLLTCWPTKED